MKLYENTKSHYYHIKTKSEKDYLNGLILKYGIIIDKPRIRPPFYLFITTLDESIHLSTSKKDTDIQSKYYNEVEINNLEDDLIISKFPKIAYQNHTYMYKAPLNPDNIRNQTYIFKTKDGRLFETSEPYIFETGKEYICFSLRNESWFRLGDLRKTKNKIEYLIGA